MLIYDPPSGWMYGFPKPYSPRKGESLEQTLIRDGYPEKELDRIRTPDGVIWGVRFLESQEELDGISRKGIQKP